MLEPLHRSARAPRTKAPGSTSLRSPTQGFRRAARTFDGASSPSRTALSREGPDWPAPAPGTAGRGFPHRDFSVCGHSNMFADTLDLIGALPGSRSACRRTRCGTASPRICSNRTPTSASSRCCSKQRHTARQHPIEGRIYYQFHPRCGENVLIVRQYAYRGLELVVIPQPDGSVACIPVWMTHELASHHQLRTEPRLSLDVLRSVRAEIGALLGFLQSDSRMEKAKNEAQKRKHGRAPCRPRYRRNN